MNFNGAPAPATASATSGTSPTTAPSTPPASPRPRYHATSPPASARFSSASPTPDGDFAETTRTVTVGSEPAADRERPDGQHAARTPPRPITLTGDRPRGRRAHLHARSHRTRRTARSPAPPQNVHLHPGGQLQRPGLVRLPRHRRLRRTPTPASSPSTSRRSTTPRRPATSPPRSSRTRPAPVTLIATDIDGHAAHLHDRVAARPRARCRGTGAEPHLHAEPERRTAPTPSPTRPSTRPARHSNVATGTITITPVNDAPVADDQVANA